jgi:hypothetical protein
MTYRCGLDSRAAALLGLDVEPGQEWQPPHIYCDHCGLKVEARTRSGGPPAWLLNGTSPRGWRTRRITDWTRRDVCPACRAKGLEP